MAVALRPPPHHNYFLKIDNQFKIKDRKDENKEEEKNLSQITRYDCVIVCYRCVRGRDQVK